MKYPFEFTEILLTDHLFTLLGLGDWWGGSGDFNDATLILGEESIRIRQQDVGLMGSGYGDHYQPGYYMTEDFTTSLYFLHELLDYISSELSIEAVEIFLTKCGEFECRQYLDEYIAYKFELDVQNKEG